jgi:hypothetical protein
MIKQSVRRSRTLLGAGVLLAGAALLAPLTIGAQSTPSGDRWLHVRVISSDADGESVSVNVPLELAEKVLPIINKNQLHGGKITVDKLDADGVDLRALLEAVKSAKDGEFVTVNGKDGEDVRVAKQGGFLLVHVTDVDSHRTHAHNANKHASKDSADKTQDGKNYVEGESAGKEALNTSVSHVEVRVPLAVVDALLSGKKDELDLLAGLRMLSAQGDTELVSVKDGEESVRVWVDSKNTNGTAGGPGGGAR